MSNFAGRGSSTPRERLVELGFAIEKTGRNRESWMPSTQNRIYSACEFLRVESGHAGLAEGSKHHKTGYSVKDVYGQLRSYFCIGRGNGT